MRDEHLNRELYIKQLKALADQQASGLAILQVAAAETVEMYGQRKLGHVQIGELRAAMGKAGGHKMLALLSRLMMLRKTVLKALDDGDYSPLRPAAQEVEAALDEGFYDS